MNQPGHIHPLTWTYRECIDIYRKMGFAVATDLQIDTEEYNFDRLNFPPDHPAREMHDTLWVDSRRLMRTHNSNLQIHVMERAETNPPVRLVFPGRVFRNERSDATHGASFEYMEGFVVDKGMTMAHLLANLETFAKEFFGTDTKVRFRPSYFPFTEPSLEMTVYYSGRWLEVMGAGMIHPNVIRQMKPGPTHEPLDPNVWSGFAFGLGIDRFMMIRYNIPDVRASYTGDLRFLKQFPGPREEL